MNENQEVLVLKCLISTAFLSGLPVTRSLWSKVKESLEILKDKFSGEELANFAIDASFNHIDVVRFPRNSSYVKSVVTWLKNIWKSKSWIGGDMFQTGSGNRALENLEIGYKTYRIGFDNSFITLLESAEGISRGTTGLSSWGAAKVLSLWCIGNPHVVEDSKVVELGAGIGYTAASILSSAETNKRIFSYTATDYHPQVLSMLHHNLSLLRDSFRQTIPSREHLEKFCLMMNAKMIAEELSPGEYKMWQKEEDLIIGSTKVAIQQLDWRQPSNIPECDVVLAADVVYAKHLFPDLVQLIRKLLSKGKKSVLNRNKTNLNFNIDTNLLKMPTMASNGNKSHGINKPLERESTGFCNYGEESLIQSKTLSNNVRNNKSPKAYVACTRRNQKTISEFLSEVNKQNMTHSLIYQSTLERDESLFGFDESHLPVKIFEIICPDN